MIYPDASLVCQYLRGYSVYSLAVINFFTKDTLIKKFNVGLDLFECLLQCTTIWL